MKERDHTGHKHFGFVRDHKDIPQGSRYSPAEAQRRAVEDECSLIRNSEALRRATEEEK